jgi:tetratricopeptide (TPR) repeat protein
VRSLRFRAACVVLAVSLALGGAPRQVLAQPPAESEEAAIARAREQFTQALALQTAGDWAGALALLKQVAAVRPTPQVRFNIALCEENLGRLVSALGDYEIAAADARDSDVAQEVDARLGALRARIPKIIIQRGEGAEAATILLDGVEIGDPVVGTPVPADPGPHVIEARAIGYKPFRQTVRLAEQQTETIVVTLEVDPVPPPESAGPVRTGAPALRTAGFVTAGVGVASLIGSGIFFYLRGQAIDDLDAECGGKGDACPESLRDTYDAGRSYNTLANVTLAIGAVGIAAGIPMILLGSSGSQEPPRAGVKLVPAAPGADGGASLVGRF